MLQQDDFFLLKQYSNPGPETRLIRTESEGRTPSIQNKKPRFVRNRVFKKKGDDILSHITAVPSAQAGLTTLFGMGRGEPRRNNHLKIIV